MLKRRRSTSRKEVLWRELEDREWLNRSNSIWTNYKNIRRSKSSIRQKMRMVIQTYRPTTLTRIRPLRIKARMLQKQIRIKSCSRTMRVWSLFWATPITSRHPSNLRKDMSYSVLVSSRRSIRLTNNRPSMPSPETPPPRSQWGSRACKWVNQAASKTCQEIWWGNRQCQRWRANEPRCSLSRWPCAPPLSRWPRGDSNIWKTARKAAVVMRVSTFWI